MIRRDPECTLCKLHKTAEYVCLLGKGPEPCDIMIVGEAPGRREDESGKPFVGKSGKLLEEMLEEQDLFREDVFITNAVSCRPPDNRKPSKGEIRQCNAWLKYQINKVKPKYVLLLGATAYQSITGSSGVTKARGQPFEQDGIIYLPTLHPASALYDPNNEPTIRADIRLFKEIIDEGGVPREHKLNWKHVLTWDDFEDLLDALKEDISCDLETTCLNPWQTHDDKGQEHPAHVTQIGFGTATGEFIIPTNYMSGSPWREADIKKMVKRIDERLRKRRDIFMIFHNGKFDCLWMWVHYDVKWHWLIDFDTMMSHYNLDENSFHDLKGLARKFCGAPNWDIDKKKKQGNTSLEKLGLYHAHDLYYTRQLYPIFNKMLKREPDSHRLFYKFTLPAIKLYTEIQYDGVFINIDKFGDAEKYLINEKRQAEKALEKYGDINWGSTKQLANLLFDELGIDPVEKTKAGNNSTSESVLKRIDHPAAGEILKFRAAKQQLSFFIEGWKPFLHKRDDGYYLHPSFKLHGTVTGRPSCEYPNLQQVPRDTRIRSLIDAPPGWVLMEFDLEQIELKLVAEDSRDHMMMHTFRTGGDIHWLTMIREFERSGAQAEIVLDTVRTYKQDKKIQYAEALEILLEMGPEIATEINKEWKELRKKAKAVNFGYVYGMWWKKFKMYARDNYDVIVTDEEAQDSRESFFETYKLHDWQKRKKAIARRKGYVCTWTGRRRRLPDAQLKGDNEFVKAKRSAAERQAVNSPIQGFAAEINIMAAIQLRKEFSRDIVRVVGTIHDAVLVWVKLGNEERVATRMLKIMQRPEMFDDFEINLDVPITADCKIGPWSEGISLKKWKDKQHDTRNSARRTSIR